MLIGQNTRQQTTRFFIDVNLNVFLYVHFFRLMDVELLRDTHSIQWKTNFWIQKVDHKENRYQKKG